MTRTMAKLTLMGAAAALIFAGCGDDDGGSETASNGTTSNGTTATSNGTTSTSNGTTATSNGTTATSNGTTATSNGTTATSNGTTATSNGTTNTSNGTTSTSNGTTSVDPVVQCQDVCAVVTACEEMIAACGEEITATALDGCNQACAEDEESRGLIVMAEGLPCNVTVGLFIQQAELGDLCSSGGVLEGDYGAFVIASDFISSALVGLDLDGESFNVISRHSGDTIIVTLGTDDAGIAVVDRTGAKVAIYLDPSEQDAEPWVLELAEGSNPQDVELLSDGTVYITQYESSELLVFAPDSDEPTVVDLSPVTTTDVDGQSEVNAIFYDADAERAYVVFQNLDRDNFFASAGPGVLAVIDTSTHTLMDMDSETDGIEGIDMPGGNPFAFAKSSDGRFAIVLVEGFGDTEGKVVLFDPMQQTFEDVVTEADVEGDISGVAETSKGWFIVSSTSSFTTRLYFLGDDGPELLVETEGFDLGGMSADPTGDLLMVTDAGMSMPGIWVWGDGDEPAGPIATGDLPPRNIVVPR